MKSRVRFCARTAAVALLIGVRAAGADQLDAQPPTVETASPEGSANQIEDIVVLGYRKSLESALAKKRQSDLPIETIQPEDLGKFPDTNVAESLQRLPGVQIDRAANGEGTAVLIDGLRYNLTTLNGNVFLTGREFYATGEASGNGAGANVQYNSLQGVPSEEIGGIDVYKSPKASITEGGLGGTIDLRTRDPLDLKEGLTLGGNFRMTSGQRQDDWTPSGTIVGGYKFNDRFAITASFSYEELRTHTNEVQDYNRNGWQINNSGQILTGGPLTAGQYTTLQKGYIEPQLQYFADIEDDQTTIGSSFGAHLDVTDAISVKFNWFYSHQQDDNTQYANKLFFNGGNNVPGTGLDASKPYSVDSNGVIASGTFVATGAETATLYQTTETEANNFQLGTKWDDGGPIRAMIDGAYSRSTYESQAAQADTEHGFYSASGQNTSIQPNAPGCNNGGGACAGAGNPPYEFQYSSGGTSGLSSYNYLAPYQDVLSNPNYALFKSNWAWADRNTARNYAIRGDVEYDASFIKAVETTFTAGVRYGDRTIDVNHGKYLLDAVDANGNPVANCCRDPAGGNWIYYIDPGYAAIPSSTATSAPGLVQVVHSFTGQTYIAKAPATLLNPAAFQNAVWTGAGGSPETVRLFTDALSSFGVAEQTTAGYLMGDVGGPNSGFHLNFGVRIVDTSLTIDGAQSAVNPTYYGTASWNGVDSNDIPVTHRRDYIDVLPSANLVVDASEAEKIRFSMARVVSPADLANLGLGNAYAYTRETGNRVNIHTGVKDGFKFNGGTAGNPNLEPYRATQASLSYENYFSKSGIVSASTFYKQVDSFEVIQNIPTLIMDDFGGTTSNVSTPENAGHGKIFGLELSGQYIFDDSLMPWLEGFGVAGNYTYSSSISDQLTSFTRKAQIPGVARHSLTTTGFYERDGFSARLSYSWRDKAVNDGIGGSTFAFGGKTYQVFSAPYGQLDLQLGYDINDHFGLTFSVQNLTDEAQHTYLQWENLPFTYDDSGRRLFLGGKFKL